MKKYERRDESPSLETDEPGQDSLEAEEKLLAKDVKNLPLDELKRVKEILESRMAVTEDFTNSVARMRERGILDSEALDVIHAELVKIEKMEENYPDDLKIIVGLIAKKTAE